MLLPLLLLFPPVPLEELDRELLELELLDELELLEELLDDELELLVELLEGDLLLGFE